MQKTLAVGLQLLGIIAMYRGLMYMRIFSTSSDRLSGGTSLFYPAMYLGVGLAFILLAGSLSRLISRIGKMDAPNELDNMNALRIGLVLIAAYEAAPMLLMLATALFNLFGADTSYDRSNNVARLLGSFIGLGFCVIIVVLNKATAKRLAKYSLGTT